MSKPFVMLAAGGTGGHVFPAEALADCLLRRGFRLGLVTDKRGHAYGGTLGSLETFRINAGGIAGRGLGAKIKGALELGVGLVQARTLLMKQQPNAVIGFGGYASLPTMAAATFVGLPTAIHEQNAVLGRANRLLAARVRRIATSYAEVEYLEPAWASKVVHTGMPVRGAIADRRGEAYPVLTETGPIRILVLGGSQGARALSEVVPAALAALPEALRSRLYVSQQCRPEDLEQVREAYKGTGIDAKLESFFADVPKRMAGAHLVIARAGASTVAELTALGRPSILVPYPFATDDHQTANARALDEAGGGWLMPQPSFTTEALAARLDSLFTQPGTLARAAECARNAGRPDAAARLADLVADLLPKFEESHP